MTTSNKKIATIAAGIAMAAGSSLVTLAILNMSPALRARELDNSAQAVAHFLQQAEIKSVGRNRPVACKIEKDGRHMVLQLDWNMNGPKLHPDGDRLELPRGIVLMQNGELQESGTLAIFNPRGGVTFGSVRPGSGKALSLELSRRGDETSGLRQISMNGTGDFAATAGTFAKHDPVETKAATQEWSSR